MSCPSDGGTRASCCLSALAEAGGASRIQAPQANNSAVRVKLAAVAPRPNVVIATTNTWRAYFIGNNVTDTVR